ncbi:3-hydroxyisobutyrate dehydrogenase, mitochondrial [Octopus sinensis]|uniref:3-hydroxyisobutyrate dehydrogenase n=1 Tax=Octopus sinensis TaxID=2607531 RepID=A0A6P7TA04_9MOLL|nr:3-hydroxyisobutyrate dehydrogenase, mitochondrial [Octopus sinensis]
MSCTSKIIFSTMLRFSATNLSRRASVIPRMYSDSASDKGCVGFVGLGNMGAHMARNLIKKGHSLVVFDLSESACNSLKEAGAKIASSPAAVAESSQKIVTMLPSSPHVKAVYCGPGGIYSKFQKGTLLMDSSTIDPAVSQEMAEKAEELGGVMVDSPVSGGILAARDALLTFMVGGTESGFAESKKILDLMGKNVIHCGPSGTGQAAKICNNMLLAISMIGTSEAMNLGIKLGLDAKMLASILNVSSGRCWSSEMYNPVPGVKEGVPSSNNYKGGFGTALMLKDLGLAQNAAGATQSPTPLGGMALNLYRIMCNNGFSEMDFSSVYKFLQKRESS